MTAKLILENLRHRPLRTLLSALLIAIPVTLMLTIVGLGRGMLEDSARQKRGVGADILIRPPGTSLLSVSVANLPPGLIKKLEEEPHVSMAVGVVMAQVQGITSVTGVDLAAFNKMSGGFKYLEGGPFKEANDILIEEYYAKQLNVHMGGTVKVLNRNWRVAGIFASGKLARIVLPAEIVQDLTASGGRFSQIYLKLDNPKNLDAVMASLRKQFDGYPIYSMEDILSQTSVESVPQVNAFINVVIAITIVVGFAVVCLSMYMAVLQRTREIGILKSLGASRAYILELIVAEAVVLGLVGTVFGIVLTYGARWLVTTLAPSSLQQAIVPYWWPRACLIVMVASLLGALYPGFSAARKDPIEALSYE